MTPEEKTTERNRLYKQLSQLESEYESGKTKRTVTTVLAFSVIFFIVLFIANKPEGFGIVGTLVEALIFGGIYVVVNTAVFSGLAERSRQEEEYIESIRKRIRDLQ